MFEVAYRTTFCAMHRLMRDGQPLEPPHGHDWQVEAVAGRATLDAAGMVVDFEVLKGALGEVVARLHHGDLNQQPALAGQSPSAEAVARHVFEQVRKGMGAEGRYLLRVRVWEAPGCSASYQE